MREKQRQDEERIASLTEEVQRQEKLVQAANQRKLEEAAAEVQEEADKDDDKAQDADGNADAEGEEKKVEDTVE